MGENKASLIYHDRPQWAYCAQLIGPYCRDVYFSVNNENQVQDVSSEYLLHDSLTDKGPAAGILAAMERHPEAAWIIMAVDMPGVDRALVNRLFRQRDTSRDATCLMRGDKLEPLLSIWEPILAKDFRDYVERGKSSLPQFLAQRNIHQLPLDTMHAHKLDSVDTPEERSNFLKFGRK
jgi:molybdopterin-guanine dinucleotide biosynthesis protein A